MLSLTAFSLLMPISFKELHLQMRGLKKITSFTLDPRLVWYSFKTAGGEFIYENYFKNNNF